MKRVLVVLLTLAMVLCLCACKEKTSTEVSSSTETSASEENSSTEETSTETSTSTEASVSASTEASVEASVEEPVDENPDIIKIEITKKEPTSEAVEFVLDMGAGFNLGNTFDSTDGKKNVAGTKYETLWGNPVTTQENIKGLKEAGFKTIRIPVSWHNHVDEKFNINEEWMNRVEEVVKWALDEDMYVILNIHHDNEKGYMYPSYDELENSKKYVKAIWSQVAKRFGNYDEKLIFESLNEPRQKDTSIEWWIDVNSEAGKECLDCVNQLNQVAVDTIRSTEGEYNKSRYITVPGYCGSPDFVLCKGFEMPDDSKASEENRILVTVHAYRPYKFALDPNGVKVFKTLGGGYELKTMCANLYNKFGANGIGVLIDEWGSVDRDGNTDYRTEHAACFVAYANANCMATCWWDNGIFSGSGERFGLYRRTKDTIEYPTILKQIMFYANR